MNLQGSALSQAAQRIAPYVRRTPVFTNEALNELAGARVFFKCENLQRIGAFKARGAFNAVLSLSRAELSKGVATHSSGNHAQALSLAASELGIPAFIVMPENSPNIKIEGVKRLGAEIRFCAPTLAARELTLKQVIEETGSVFIPPYDSEEIIAGQSTATLELLDQIDTPDAIIAPLGGGGLLSGTALAASYFSHETAVYGAEPVNVDDGKRSFLSGVLESNPPGATTFADGLRTHLSERTLAYIRSHVRDILTAEESEILEAMHLIWNHLKIIVEPSAAVPFAVLLKNAEKFRNQDVAIILSGGNIDLAQFKV